MCSSLGSLNVFSGVKNKNLKPHQWSEEPPVGPDQLGLQCFAKPVMDSRELNLLFPFLDEENLFESQPSRYISHLIGHEGPGSIMAYIKSKGWANGLSAGAYSICPGSPGLFDCQISVDRRGKMRTPLLSSPFPFAPAHLRLEHLTHFVWVTGPQELQRNRESLLPIRLLAPGNTAAEMDLRGDAGIAEVDFKFKQKSPASSFTSKISTVMKKPLPANGC